jgi:TetR/AcrR family transcriptional repressor of nem operon
MTKAEKTKAFIIETSAVLFLKHGYEATSLSMLTNATGLTKGAIYGNFKDKEDLAKQVYHYTSEILITTLKSHIDTQQSAQLVIRKLLGFYKTYPDFARKLGSCPIVSFGVQSAVVPDIQSLVNQTIARIEEIFTRVLSLGQENGEFYLSLPPTVFAKQLFALLQGGVAQSLITKDDKYAKNTATYIEHLFQTAVQPN